MGLHCQYTIKVSCDSNRDTNLVLIPGEILESILQTRQKERLENKLEKEQKNLFKIGQVIESPTQQRHV